MFGRTTKTTMFGAVFFALMMLGVPSFLNDNGNLGASQNAAAADVDRVFICGQDDMTWATLSPFKYTSAAEMMTIWPCYSTMLTYDVDGKLVGDLAQSWRMSTDGLNWTFKIANNAYFIDRAAPDALTHKVTVYDIMYTFWQTQNYTNNLHGYFPTLDGKPLIKKMTANGSYEITIFLSFPYAPWIGTLTAMPIIPQYYWEPHEDAKGDATGWTGAGLVGSGPWYYYLAGLPSAGEVTLKRNTHWFHELNEGWQVHVDTLIYRSMTDPNTAFLELQAGNIDVFLFVPPATYTTKIPDPANYIVGWAQSTGFVYEYNLNQMTDAVRDGIGGAYARGTNSQLLQDPVVKEAMAKLVNKTGFIKTVLENLGTVGDSLVPDVNPWHYKYGGPTAPPGETPIVYDPVAARAMLNGAGWKYDLNGALAGPTTVPLYKKDATGKVVDPLSFRFFTLNTADEWLVGANLIKEWAAEGGVQLNLEQKSYNQLSSDWLSADYDTWLWDWMFSPTSDVSTDVLSVLTTMELTTWQDVFWCNDTFNDLYNASLLAMDPAARRTITDEMQRMAYENMGCQMIAYRKELYAASQREWVDYGNWEEKYLLMPDQLAPYLYMQISPNGPSAAQPNRAPQITTINAATSGEVNKAFAVSVSASDAAGTNLVYHYWWGDGTNSTAGSSTTHTYLNDGVYTIWVQAKESNTDDKFATVKSVSVKIIDTRNRAPTSLAFTVVPGSPDTGDLVTLSGSATDADKDPLYFSWNFGDGGSDQGQVVKHQFKRPGTWQVTMSVTDNHYGSTPRPVNYTKPVTVTENRAPTVSVSDQSVTVKIATSFTVGVSDADSDPLRLTWTWGDGKRDVMNLVAGATSATATHTYAQKGSFNLVVYADDLTGLSGHNASDLGVITVVDPRNAAPVITGYTLNATTKPIGAPILFTCSAKDADGDAMRFSFKFGDGSWMVIDKPAAGANQVVTVTTTHFYDTAGVKTTYCYVTDGQANTTSPARTVTITAPNQPPQVQPLVDVAADVGEAITFTASAYDPDMDTLKYTWNFGDGSALKVGQTVTYAYPTAGVYDFTVYVDDGKGHNVSDSASATISAVATYGLLRVTSNPAVPSMIYIDGNWASPWGLNWVKLPAGLHTLSFSDVPGFITPASASVTITAGQTTEYVAQFVPCGSFRVITSPAVPSTIYVNGIPRNDWGFWIDAPAGTYTVSFGAVMDYATPAPQTVTVTSGGYTEVTGTFVSSPGSPGPDPATYGMLRLTTSPAVPSMVYIDGNWACPWGLNWVKLSVGSHVLSYSDVPGFVTPADQTITITAGQTTEIVASFGSTGSLRVITSPAVPSTVYVNGIPRNDWGLWADVPAGTYTVTFGDVAGYVTPAGQTVTLTAGGYQEVTGVFVPG